MAVASDNVFPKVIIAEGAAPASPAAGDFKLFVDSADHLFKMKNSAGTVTTFGAGFSDPMTTRGDIIIRNASNVTARLGRGSAGQVFTSDGTDVAWATPAGGGSSRPYLSGITLHGTYGDDFTGASLDAKWTKRNLVTGDLTFQDGGGTYLSMLPPSGNASQAIFQPYTVSGAKTFLAAYNNWQNAVGIMVGPAIIDSSGNGCAALWYDNVQGLYLAKIVNYLYDSSVSNSTFVTWPQTFELNVPVWLGLRDNANGTYTAMISFNGYTWSPEVTGTPTAFTANRVGFGRLLGTPTTGQHKVSLDVFNAF